MPRRNAAASEAADLRNALRAIGRVIGDNRATPRGKLQQITGILFCYDVMVQPVALPAKEGGLPL